jgi:MFS family permease
MINMARLGTSLSMQGLNFNVEAIASAAAVSGLVSVPITLSVGVLSDRFGKKRFLIASYILAALGSLTLGAATQLWQFGLASSLMMVGFSLNRAMSTAIASDVLARESLSRGLSMMNTINSAASIISFAWVGFLLDQMGPQVVFLSIAAVPVLALFGLRRLPSASSGKTSSDAQSISKSSEAQAGLVKNCV